MSCQDKSPARSKMPPPQGRKGPLLSKCFHLGKHCNPSYVCHLTFPSCPTTIQMVMPTIDQNKAGEHPQGSAPFASRSDLAACSLVPRAIKMGSPLNTGAACVYLLLNKTILKTQQLFKQGRKKARLHQLWCLLYTCILVHCIQLPARHPSCITISLCASFITYL